jgi:hypothetical protein
MRLYDAIVAEHRAKDALIAKINAGITLEEPKVPVLKLVGAYRAAVERRKAIEIRDAVLERVPS